VALAAASLVTAKPIPQAGAKVGFTVNQSIPKPFQAGPVVLKNALVKYGAAVPEDVAAAAAQGSVTATPEQYDSEYLCPVDIGGETLNLDFDTGSADLYVFMSRVKQILTMVVGSFRPSCRPRRALVIPFTILPNLIPRNS
jgi:aspergillopepsin I